MKYLTALLALLLIVSCSSEQQHKDPDLRDKNVPLDFDLGVADDGTYTNNYFGLRFDYPKDWSLQDQKEMNALLERGIEYSTNGNEKEKKKYDAALVNTANLFGMFEHEIGSPIEYNNSLLVLAENIKQYPGLKTGKEYLKQVEFQLKKTSFELEVEGYSTTYLGSKKFDILTLSVPHPILDSKITLRYHTLVFKGFSLSFVQSHMGEEGNHEVERLLGSVRFI